MGKEQKIGGGVYVSSLNRAQEQSFLKRLTKSGAGVPLPAAAMKQGGEFRVVTEETPPRPTEGPKD